MKFSTLVAYAVPELRNRTSGQLLSIWQHCSGYSRNVIYLHMILLLAGCSAIFNLFLYFTDSVLLILIGLLLGLLLPPNLYFMTVLGNRREQIRQFIMDNWAEFQS